MGPTGARNFSCVFIFIGGGLLYLGVQTLFEAFASNRWPATQGKVMSSTVEMKHTSDGVKMYYAKVLYEYSVAGTTLSSSHVTINDCQSSDPAPARNMVSKYPPGTSVTVHYVAPNPAKAVIEPGISEHLFLLPVVGLGFMSAGTIYFMLATTVIRRERLKRAARSDGMDVSCREPSESQTLLIKTPSDPHSA